MLTTRIFRPTLNAGMVYARAYGTAVALQSIGGLAELTLAVEEDIKKQQDKSRAGGGTRSQVNRIKSVAMKAKLQDLNPVNLARGVFGSTSAIANATVTDEAVKAYKGGLIRLEHLNPNTVVLKKDAVTIAMAGNYEVRPEGLFVYDDAAGITDDDDLTVSYAHSGYDLIEALTQAAPTLEMLYAGVNEADGGSASTVELFKVRTSALKGWGLINDDFAELDMEGEVLLDPTKSGAGLSKFFRVRMA